MKPLLTHPDLVRARASARVLNAIKAGRLTRQPCEQCGATPTDGHHDDYSRPLDVRWLCRRHHRQLHGKRRAAESTAA